MAVYLVGIAYIILAPHFCVQITKDVVKGRKWYIISVCALFTLMTGLRSLEVGADTINYKASYEIVANTSWTELFTNFYTYIHSTGGMLQNNSLRDPAYNCFVKLTQIVCCDYRFYMFVMGLVVNIPLGKWVYDNSKKPYMTFLVYFILNYSFYGTTGYRQTIAFTLATFVGYKFIKERRFVSFLIVIAIAFFFHKSVLIVLLFYFLANKKITPSYTICALLGIGMTFVFRVQFSQFWKQLSGYGEMYTGQYEGAGTWTFTMMLGLVLVVSLVFKYLILDYDEQATHYLNALILAAIFVPLTFINPSSMRIVEYFSIYMTLLLPDMLSIVQEKDRRLASALVVIVLVLLYIKSGQTYYFM